MVWPAIIAGAAAVGSSLLKNRADAKSAAQDVAYQREFAQHGVRWKVEDAKAAGLHPLYAIGASTHSFQPVSAGADFSGVAEAGRQAGNYLAQREEARGRESAEAEARLSREAAERRAQEAHDSQMANDLVQRQMMLSGLRLAGQPGHGIPLVQTPSMPTSPQNIVGGTLKAGVELVPDKVTAGKGGFTAGVHPAATRVELPISKSGRTMAVPSGALMEALEDMELAKYAAMISMNRDGILNFFTQDLPWAMRGYADDLGLTKWLHSKRKPSVYERLRR